MPFQFDIQSYQPAHFTPLAGACLPVAANVLSLDGNRMELLLDEPAAPGTPVRVQARNWLMLGEVLHCAKERTRYKIGVRLEHALANVRELTDRNRHFLGQTARPSLTDRDGYSGWT